MENNCDNYITKTKEQIIKDNIERINTILDGDKETIQKIGNRLIVSLHNAEKIFNMISFRENKDIISDGFDVYKKENEITNIKYKGENTINIKPLLDRLLDEKYIYFIDKEKICYCSDNDKLKTALNRWKDILNLDKWDIAIKYDAKLDCQGSVDIESQNCTALIKIKEPSTWNNPDFVFSVEQVLIHELLHIKFNLVKPDDDTKYTLYHQQINDLSKVLFTLSRNN